MRGFTLVELLLVIAIITIMAGLSIPFVQNTQLSTDLGNQTQSVISLVRRAQRQAIDGQNAIGWGVNFDNSNKIITLFAGSDFVNRDVEYDYISKIPNLVELTTDFGDQIFFPLYSSEPTASGTVEIVSNNQDSRKVIINGYGKIESAK